MSVKVPSLVVFSYFVVVISAGDVVNVINGIYSKKTVSDGIFLKATSTFQPVHPLTTTIHISKLSSVFVHYGITFASNGKDFQLQCWLIGTHRKSDIQNCNRTLDGFTKSW